MGWNRFSRNNRLNVRYQLPQFLSLSPSVCNPYDFWQGTLWDLTVSVTRGPDNFIKILQTDIHTYIDNMVVPPYLFQLRPTIDLRDLDLRDFGQNWWATRSIHFLDQRVELEVMRIDRIAWGWTKHLHIAVKRNNNVTFAKVRGNKLYDTLKSSTSCGLQVDWVKGYLRPSFD